MQKQRSDCDEVVINHCMQLWVCLVKGRSFRTDALLYSQVPHQPVSDGYHQA